MANQRRRSKDKASQLFWFFLNLYQTEGNFIGVHKIISVCRHSMNQAVLPTSFVDSHFLLVVDYLCFQQIWLLVECQWYGESI